jgi:hypothetical protein
MNSALKFTQATSIISIPTSTTLDPSHGSGSALRAAEITRGEVCVPSSGGMARSETDPAVPVECMDVALGESSEVDALRKKLPFLPPTPFRVSRVTQRSAVPVVWRHERRSNVRSLSTWGSRKIDLAILQAVAGHRQVLPTHHTARKIISEPKKSHSRSGLVKELIN